MFKRIKSIIFEMQRFVLSKIPDWEMLRIFGQNKLLKSSYFWFFFVPICAKALQGLPDPIILYFPDSIRSLSQPVELDGGFTIRLSLPFTWQAMFFASVSFSIASILFAWRCPPLIRDFTNPTDFTDKGRSPFHIWSYLKETRTQELPESLERNGLYGNSSLGESLRTPYFHNENDMKIAWRHFVPNDNKFLEQQRDEYFKEQMTPDGPDDEYAIPDTPWHRPISDDHFKLLFYGARHEMQVMDIKFRIACATFYTLGFAAILIIACENILSVWRTL